MIVFKKLYKNSIKVSHYFLNKKLDLNINNKNKINFLIKIYLYIILYNKITIN